MPYKKRTAPKPTKDQLEILYNAPMGLRQLAQETGTSVAYIHRLMREYGIPTRTHSQGLRISLNTPIVQEKLRKTRGARIQQGFFEKHMARLTHQIRVCIQPLMQALRRDQQCHACQRQRAVHVHHTTPLRKQVLMLLTEGHSDLDIVVQLVTAHYARDIELIPMCADCHKNHHCKTQ